MYCSIDDLKAIIPEKDLINLTNDTAPAVEINTNTVAECVEFADELINASLRNQYKLPLEFVPKMVSNLSADISAYRLYSRRPRTIPEHIKDNYKFARETLLQLQKGAISLDLPNEHEDENIQAPKAVYMTNKKIIDRLFSDSVMSAFRC